MENIYALVGKIGYSDCIGCDKMNVATTALVISSGISIISLVIFIVSIFSYLGYHKKSTKKTAIISVLLFLIFAAISVYFYIYLQNTHKYHMPA